MSHEYDVTDLISRLQDFPPGAVMRFHVLTDEGLATGAALSLQLRVDPAEKCRTCDHEAPAKDTCVLELSV